MDHIYIHKDSHIYIVRTGRKEEEQEERKKIQMLVQVSLINLEESQIRVYARPYSARTLVSQSRAKGLCTHYARDVLSIFALVLLLILGKLQGGSVPAR